MNKVIDNIKTSISDKFNNSDKKTKTKLLVVLAIIAMVLILISTGVKDNPKNQQQNTDNLSVDTKSYESQLKSELIGILTKIKGVGNVDVMITFDGSTEYVYAEEKDIKSREGENDYEHDTKNEYVIVEEDGNEKALIKKVLKPQINGVIVVCDGGDSAVIEEKIRSAVSSVLNISITRVVVAKR